jgi:hypothetical protein
MNTNIIATKNLPSMVDAEYGSSGCAIYALVDSASDGVSSALACLRVLDFDGVDELVHELHKIHQALHVVYMTRFDD